WREAQRVNTAAAYRTFINTYPRSPYVPAATAKLSALVKKNSPPTLWDVSREGSASKGTGGRSSGGGGGKSGDWSLLLWLPDSRRCPRSCAFSKKNQCILT